MNQDLFESVAKLGNNGINEAKTYKGATIYSMSGDDVIEWLDEMIRICGKISNYCDANKTSLLKTNNDNRIPSGTKTQYNGCVGSDPYTFSTIKEMYKELSNMYKSISILKNY